VGIRFGYALAVIGAAVAFCGQVATSEEAAQCDAPAADADWPSASPEQAGLDADILCSLAARLDRFQWNVHSVLVARDGQLVLETYRTGADQVWGTDLGVITHTADMPHDVRSVSKSVVSLLVGIALDRGLIGSIDEPVLGLLPEYAATRTPEKDRIRLRHLLTMTSGFAWNEGLPYEHPRNSERLLYESAEPYRYVLEQTTISEAGEQWSYNGGNTMLLGAVLQDATGQPLVEFAREALFEPLGITDFTWTTVEPSGEPAASGGLRLRPRDMAKIGQLVLNGGTWDGRRIVSEQWIRESTEPRYDGWRSHRYGYQWWVGESRVRDRDVAWVAAWGLGGQRIYIVPAYDLVAVITAGLYTDSIQDAVAQDILNNGVLAAIRE
jgi:CubicO group peptidase (beta-lactamase class C family)